MSQHARKWLFRIGTLIVAGTLLYLALRGIAFDQLVRDLAGGQYVWIIPLFLVTLLSHAIRAWRWRLLLHALPERNSSDNPVSFRVAFSSLMIGYMVNYAVPRFGEIVRTSHLSLRERMSFGSVFGTVVAERVLDMATLAVCFLSVPVILGDRVYGLVSIVVNPIRDMLEGNLTELLLVSILGTGAIILGIILLLRKRIGGASQSKIGEALQAFRLGLFSLIRTKRPIGLAVSTAFIWFCYAFMAYIPLLIFGLAGSNGLGFADAWTLMLIGALGVVVPSPGGIGSYHFLTIQALVLIWAVSQEAAASYAIFTHAGQMILYAVVGFGVILMEGASWNELKAVSIENAASAGLIEQKNRLRRHRT